MKLYVGNLSREATDDDLKQAFEPFGQVTSATVIKERFSGESKGFGFVEMPTKAEAESAIAGLNGKEMRGRSIKVNESQPRPAGSGDRRGGGGGYGGGGRRW